MEKQYAVYSYMGDRNFMFKTEEKAKNFFDIFPSDARLLDAEGEIIDEKQVIGKSFAALVKAGLYVLYLRRGLPNYEDPENHPQNFFVNENDLQIYATALDCLRTNKGLYLCGGIGVGKTSIFEFFNIGIRSKYIVDITPFKIISCASIAKGYKERGMDIFDDLKIHPSYSETIVLDDFGFDLTMGSRGYIKYYGDSLQVMGHVMYMRHSAYITTGLQTHLTSNLSLEEIAQSYSDPELQFDRLSSRIKECTTIIEVNTPTKR